jgi:Tetratricopeptide repeat
LRNDLAELYRAQGCYGEAEPLYKRDLAITEKARGPDHSDVGASVKNVRPVPYSVGQQRNTKRGAILPERRSGNRLRCDDLIREW